MDGKEFYNEMHKNNPTRWDVIGGWHPFDGNVKNALFALFGTKRIQVIDLGCGNGRTLKFIEAPNIMSTGVDYSEEAIKLASNKNIPYADWHVADMTNLHFIKSSSYDAVISVGSFEHQPVLDFSEPRRLVRSDGWFLCVLPDVIESKGLTVAADGKHHDWELTKSEWIAKVEPFGFIFQDYLNPWTFIFKPI